MTTTANARPRLMERYRRFLPVTDATPNLSLGEGATPLVRAERLGTRDRRAQPVPQGRGPEPDRIVQGPRDGRWPSRRPSRRGRRPSSAHRPATPRPRRRPTARTPGSMSSSSCPRARSRSASCSRRSTCGARVVAIDGNFDQALHIVRALAEQDDHPVTLVNSVNPFRLDGQKTAAFEICDDLGRAPDILAIPVGNAGNISAYWAGFREYADAGLVSVDAGDVGVPGGRRRARSSTVDGWSDRRPSPPRSASAIRRRGRRPSPPARRAAAGSRRSPTTRSSPPTATSPGSRACSASPRRRPSVAGLRKMAQGRAAGPGRDGRRGPDRSRAQGSEDGRAPGPGRASRPHRRWAPWPSRSGGGDGDDRPLARRARRAPGHGRGPRLVGEPRCRATTASGWRSSS